MFRSRDIYLDFCVYGKSTDFQIRDVIIGIDT